MARRGRSRVLAGAAIAACSVLAGCGGGAETLAQPTGAAEAGILTTTGSAPGAGGLAIGGAASGGVELLGAAEVPGPGHPDGSGRALVAVVPERGEVCVEIEVRGLDQPVGAHLHEGRPGVAGGVVLGLPSPKDGDGSVDACVSAAADVIDRLTEDPGAFYVNVHSAAFPDGAVRGQLDGVTPPSAQP